jgi:hypothetical protein
VYNVFFTRLKAEFKEEIPLDLPLQKGKEGDDSTQEEREARYENRGGE